MLPPVSLSLSLSLSSSSADLLIWTGSSWGQRSGGWGRGRAKVDLRRQKPESGSTCVCGGCLPTHTQMGNVWLKDQRARKACCLLRVMDDLPPSVTHTHTLLHFHHRENIHLHSALSSWRWCPSRGGLVFIQVFHRWEGDPSATWTRTRTWV